MLYKPTFHGIIDFDVAGSGQRDEQLILKMRQDLLQVLTEVLANSSIDINDVPRENLGDGFRFILPSDLALTDVLRPIVQELDNRLRLHRKGSAALALLRLRMAVHQGYLHQDAGGWAGEALKHTARLLNATPVRAALAARPEANLVVVVSQDVYNSVIRHGYGPSRDTFRRIRIKEKELKAIGWVHTPNLIIRPGPWRIIAIALAITIVLAAAAFVLTTNLPKQGSSHDQEVTIYNKIVTGASGIAEDRSPAFLSNEPRNFCKDRGCAVPSTDMMTGEKAIASCQITGENNTNGNNNDPGDDKNAALYTSARWYRVSKADGKAGYISEVWLNPNDRGGLGLPTCTTP